MKASAEVVQGDHIRRAVHERVQRVNLIEDHVQESMARNVIVVATEGEAVGQVNGLSVIEPRRHRLRPAVADHRQHGRRARGNARPPARGAALGADPLQGGADPAGLPRRPLRPGGAAYPGCAPLLRAELRPHRGRQRHGGRDGGVAVADRRRSREAVPGRHGLDGPARSRCRRSAARTRRSKASTTSAACAASRASRA